MNSGGKWAFSSGDWSVFYLPLSGLDEGVCFHSWQRCLSGGFVMDTPLWGREDKPHLHRDNDLQHRHPCLRWFQGLHHPCREISTWKVGFTWWESRIYMVCPAQLERRMQRLNTATEKMISEVVWEHHQPRFVSWLVFYIYCHFLIHTKDSL